MLFKILFLILCFNSVPPIGAFPGSEVIQILFAVRHVYSEFLLFRRPLGRFNQLFLKYFSTNSQNLDHLSELTLRIKIHSHISLLEWKILQNKHKIAKNNFIDLENDLKRVFVRTLFEIERKEFTLKRYYHLVFCRLLQRKYELFIILNETFLGETNKWPNCASESAILATFEENRDQISEWILSDLMHFLPKKQNLMAFFKDAAHKCNESQINEIQQKIENLIGVAGFQLFHKTILEPIKWPIRDPKFPYQSLYNELFVADTKLRKWRAKIVLEKFLYDESALKLFEDEVSKAIKEEDNYLPKNLTAFQERINFISEMKHIWTICSENFWFNEKIIREKVENLVRRNKGKNLEMVKETLLAHRKEMNEMELRERMKIYNISMLWKNGPEDTALFRALSICIGESFVEFAKKYGGISREHLDELSATEQLKVINCVAKKVKRNEKRDEIVAKLHFEKIKEIIEGEWGDEFKDKLKKNSKEWRKILELNGNKMKELLAESEYFSTNESVALSSSDDSSAIESEENYQDAKAEENFNENDQKNDDKISEQNLPENLWENAKNKLQKEAKNKTKSYYGRKEKKKANLEKKKTMEERENEQQIKTPKYSMKLSKNKEHKKKN